MATRMDQIRRRAYEKCIPLNVSFEITLRCNLRCVHCYNFDRDLPYAPEKNRDDELALVLPFRALLLQIYDDVRYR